MRAHLSSTEAVSNDLGAAHREHTPEPRANGSFVVRGSLSRVAPRVSDPRTETCSQRGSARVEHARDPSPPPPFRLQPLHAPIAHAAVRLFVLGATGKTGSAVTRLALRDGHTVTAFVRSPDKLTPATGLIVVKGTPADVAAMTTATSSAPHSHRASATSSHASERGRWRRTRPTSPPRCTRPESIAS